MTKIIKSVLGIFCLGLFGLTFAPIAVYAHGEKSLEPFIRMVPFSGMTCNGPRTS